MKTITLLRLTVVMLGAALTSAASAQVQLQGNLSGILTQGFYHVVSNLMVPTNQTLVIEAGAILKFETNTSLTIAGTLNANGEPTNKVVFTCVAEPRQPGSWLGIVISKTASTGNTSLLSHVEISYANYGIMVRGSGPSLLLTDSIVTSSRYVGVRSDSQSFLAQSDVQIIRCKLINNGGAGVDVQGYASGCSSDDSGAIIESCEIAYNGGAGIELLGTGSSAVGCSPGQTGEAYAAIRRNYIHHNLHGILASGFSRAVGFGYTYGHSAPTAENNLIVSNSSHGIFLRGSVGGRTVNNVIAYNGACGVNHEMSFPGNVTIRNNIVLGHTYGFRGANPITNVVDSHGFNLVFGNTAANWTNYPSEFGLLTTNNVNGTPADLHSNISVDPLFYGGGDFRLQFGSPAINAGSSVNAPAADYFGAPRDFTPDLGIHELLAFAETNSITKVVGNSANLAVTVNAPGTFTYQWQHNGLDIPDATNANVTVWNAETTAAGSYRVIVTGSSGSITSQPVVLTLQTVLAWGNGAATNVPAGLNNVKVVAAGDDHSVALHNDGTVTAWGENLDGALSIPTNAQSQVTAIAAAGRHTLALKSDGSVVAWGEPGNGATHVPPSAQTNVRAIATSVYQSLAVKNDGTVVPWGSMFTSAGYQPATVPAGITGIVSAACGLGHTIALKSNGTLTAWGLNNFGQATIPFSAQTNVKAVAAGHYFSIALKHDGTVIAWGYANEGQTAVPSLGQQDIISVHVGGDQCVAVKKDGTVVTWGARGVSIETNYPQTIAAAVGGYAGGHHIVAILDTPVLAPTLRPVFANGQVQIQLQGQTNRVWVLQTSMNLQDWGVLARITNSTGTVLVPDTGASNFQRRFYRAVSP